MKTPPPVIGNFVSLPDRNSAQLNRTTRSVEKSTILLTSFLLALLTAKIQAQNLIFNGGFESPEVQPGSYILIQPDQTLLPGWVVTQTSVDIVHQNFLGGTAFEGVQFLDLDGSPGPGSISQELAMLPGTTYELSFAYANNFISQQSTAFAEVRIYDPLGDVLEPVTFSHSSSYYGNMGWTLFSSTFVASQSLATLEFRSLSGNANGGILLDGISVTAIPEPSPLALIAAATAGWGLCFRRRAYTG